jgi:3-hydroxybutyryl-CoA dehydrogenase
MSKIRSVGVIGAGQMGGGIAHVFGLAGYQVVLFDIDHAQIDKALATIEHNLGRQVAAGTITEDGKRSAIGRIATTTKLDDLGGADLAIEAVTENEEVKRSVYGAVCPVLKPDAILATNTSSISVTRLAAATDRPEKFIGMHFMNPVPMMELIELIRGIATNKPTFDTISALTVELGKQPVAAEDFPSFIVNRILLPMINEAVYVLYEGVGSVNAIDTAMRLGAKHPMGPLQLADFIGLDTCLAVMQVLYEGLADSKYRPCPLLVKYVEAGWLGRKAGRGFYDYSGDEPVPTR